MTEGTVQGRKRTLRLREQGLNWQVVGDQVVVLDLHSSQYLEINASGALLFCRVADGATLEDLAAELEQRYALTPQRATSDAEAFVRRLSEAGLLAP